MSDFDDLIRDGFKIIDGKLCDHYGSSMWQFSNIRLREFGWGTPGTEYHFDDFSLAEYSIVKAVHYDEWYLKKGYQEIRKLRYLGGLNWETI